VKIAAIEKNEVPEIQSSHRRRSVGNITFSDHEMAGKIRAAIIEECPEAERISIDTISALLSRYRKEEAELIGRWAMNKARNFEGEISVMNIGKMIFEGTYRSGF